ncbi:cobyric acid synthase CobQ [Candidatus Synechococcus calcipolaris G9]|uniref:Cobyric acid synthase n=2 Tax=Synechococcus TaxID=1129 RepID=A0ABT6F389_9SYNE|nr:cobyric acid synthase CobQ [Candidatus Synechococcus calcipolaris]MDG2992270.1 cobyric acid synthase CobQ [Candidatus Synechococcus calcipolaris G9]
MNALMVVGTTSHAGKSLIAAVLCRLLARRGLRVTPFKGQNMALNAYVTASGGEMGYAQAVQAWAAGIEPETLMNPILLKPQGDMTSQVIFNGQAVGCTQAADYYRDYFEPGWATIQRSLELLGERFDWVVCEGAGSPAEINLKHRDLTNMRLARHLQATTLLVADIDRGGVFAHIVGTLELLEPEERALIKGIVINKFRGQRSLLESGITWLEERTGIPVLGVIPWLEIQLPAEDSLDLFDRRPRSQRADLTIAVIRLRRIANFTDFDPLAAEPTVNLHYLYPHETLGAVDAVIIPGTKTTIPDLLELQTSGMAAQLQAYGAAGGTIMGICGGMQLLGTQICDRQGLEGQPGTYAGLGLLPLETTITATKLTRQRQGIAQAPIPGQPIQGYEIHQGQTQYHFNEDFCPLFVEEHLGIVNSRQTLWGSYLHGLFENGTWRRQWLNHLRQKRNLPPLTCDIQDYEYQRLAHLDGITDAIAPHLNLDRLLENCVCP